MKNYTTILRKTKKHIRVVPFMSVEPQLVAYKLDRSF